MMIMSSEEANVKRIGNRCWPILLAAMLAFAGPAGNVQAGDTPQSMSQLWQKAAAYRTTRYWVPGRLVQHERTYDLRGRLEEDRRVVIGYSPAGQSHIRKNLLTAEENGRDILWQVRAALEDTITLDELAGDSPFAPAQGQQVSSHFNGERRTIKEHICLGFEFIFITDKATVEGIAWLDQQTGLPAEIHSRIVSVPFIQGSFKVSSYMKSEYYTLTDQDDCMLERTQVEMDVAVPKLWFKGQLKFTSACENHWKFLFPRQHHAAPQTLSMSQSPAIH